MKDINLCKFKGSIYLKKIKFKEDISKNEECDGFLLDSSEKEARRIVQSLKGSKKVIALLGRNGAFNRRVIETLKINYLVSPERKEGKDNLKQRNSGLNHVMAKIAKMNKIKIVIDIDGLSKIKGEERVLKIGKIIQNIKICRKANCDVKIASFAKSNKEILGEKSRKSIGLSFGMSSSQANKATQF